MPHAGRLRVHRRERGSAVGAVVFALVLAAIMVGGYHWLQGRRDASEAAQRRTTTSHNGGAADKWTRALGAFLTQGPKGGTWETRYLSCVYTHCLAPHPSKQDVFLIAQVTEGKAQAPRVVSRWLVPRHFFRAPPFLFFSNYARAAGPTQETLPDGTATRRVHWVPRAESDGLTERRVWFSDTDGAVVQVEDRSRSGHLIRRVRRVSTGTGDWDPNTVDPAVIERVERDPPEPGADPDVALQEVALQAPFRIYRPAYVPTGFVLVRSSYTMCSATRAAVLPSGQVGTPVQLVTQLYSDGLALISVGVALHEDMDIIEVVNSGMEESDDPTRCPGRPADPRDIRVEKDRVVRMRSDACRTVLRRDDLEDVSVTLIGRNELSSEEYLRMIEKLDMVPGPERVEEPVKKPK